MSAGGDPWRISAEERAKHDAQFFQLKPISGFISGDQARNFFLQSGLQMVVLGQIWSLADLNADGKMDRKEFSIAMHLIQKKLHGFELPRTLPPSMKQDPPAPVRGTVGSFGSPMAGGGMGGMVGGMVPMPQQQPIQMGNVATVRPGFPATSYGNMPMSNGMPMMGNYPSTGQPGFSPQVPVPNQIATAPYGSPVKMPPPATTTTSMTADWTVPQSSKLKYTQLFNMNDRMKRGHLTGMEARGILTRSGLVHTVLAQVWGLADIDGDGKLTCDEFILAMHLVDIAKSGQALPAKLTPDLIPPSYRQNKPGHAVGIPPGGIGVGIAPLPATQSMPPQADKFGELLGNLIMPSTTSNAAIPQQTNGATMSALEADLLAQATFEDRRKENFDKGQAELDRRRQLLADQQQKEKQARLAKEREEFEKREQKRLQQEQKKQQELERQLEKQRQIEQQREEERRKALEQREAARRELEHQRQLEWERQRRDQLMAEKQRMRTHVDEFHGVVSKYKLELEALDGKKKDMGTLIEEARSNVTNVTSQIDRMRQSRDMKIHDIEKLQQEAQTWRNKLLLVQQERQQIDIEAQVVNGSMDDTYKTVMHSYNTKKTNIGKLKDKLADIEKKTAEHLASIDAQNSKFADTQQKLDGLQADNDGLKTISETTQEKQNDVFGAFNSTSFSPAFETTTTTSSTTSPETSTATLNKVDDSWASAFNSSSSNTTEAAIVNNKFDESNTAAASDSNGQTGGKDLWTKDLFSADLFSSGTSGVAWGSSAVSSPATASNSDSKWDAFSTTPQSTKQLPTDVPKHGYRKFRGLFQFDSRNPDEVSFGPGDMIWVKPDQSDAEEGWMGGQVNGNEGWFPQAYAEEVPIEPGEQPPSADAQVSLVMTTKSNNTSLDADTMAQESQIPSITSDSSACVQSNQPTEPSFGSGFGDDFASVPGPDAQNSGSLTASIDSSFTAVAPGAPSPTPGQGQTAPNGLQAKAVNTWRAKKDNHLTFEKGDIILVKEQQDMWWSGQLNGKTGWFPKSYVKVIGGQALNTVTSAEAGAESFTNMSPELYQNADFTSAQTQQDQPKSTSDDNEQTVAIYTYSSNEPGDLMFNQGDVITITRKDGDWWHGIIDDRTGMFPANYVKPLSEIQQHIDATASAPVLQNTNTDNNTITTNATADIIPEATVTEASPTVEQDVNGFGIEHTTSEPNTAGHMKSNGQVPMNPIKSPLDSLRRSSQMGMKKGEIAQVIAPYQATGNEQLSLQPGQLIQVRKKSNSGWWEGELQARGQKRKIGWFPANYVKLLAGSGSARSTPAEKSNLSTSPLPHDGSRSVTPVSLPAPTSAPSLEQVVSLYNYAGQHDDELSFAKGSVINVLNKDDPDWWKGELNGSEGMFPSNYVAPLSEAITEKPDETSFDGEDIELKRQKLIHELINTEETYVKDLDILLNVFYKPFKQSGILTKEELDTLFVNLRDIRRCNIKMLNGFRVRKRTCEGDYIYYIGDILCENLPGMAEYIRFCSCQLNAINLIKSKTDEDPRFIEIHKNSMRDARTIGLPLGSFLLKPMQRITKYALLIEKIFKYTPEDHADFQNIQEANIKAAELCTQVNEGVNEKENSDKLEWIQAHVTCEGLPEKLTFNSLTNCLGPRKFYHSGTLYKAKSGKELAGFLFNDFVLLTQPQQSIGDVASVFSFDIQTDTQFRIYRTPLFLNEIMVKKGAEGENTLFHISHADRMYSLKAISTSERDFWVRKVEAAAKNYLETEKKKREKAHQAKLLGGKSIYGRLLVLMKEGIDLIAADDNVRRQPAVGRILVVLMEGTNLVAGEDGKSDPYCDVSMGAQEHKTKVINNTLNPKWNHSMQFSIRDPQEDVLCITVYDRDLFTPNDFLGRTEIRIKDIFKHSQERKGPIIKRLKLYEVESGEVIVKLDLQLFDKT